MNDRFDPQGLFGSLHAAGVRYVVVGGWAVNAHGYRRYTGDVDICPDPAPDNLARLATLLGALDARQLGLDDFAPDELPGETADPDSLAAGGNFRTLTTLGVLDIMQWLSGDGDDVDFTTLIRDAITVEVFGTPVTICSLDALRSMKRAAGRPKDLDDLEALQGL